ncbi:hypothetical protein GCM10023176_45570 [Micromonospora coerulea]|uniref:Uncharacterized protein n=1 Tax=Micromonospora coerulea TaxID=47856 RepID=A0ABP8SX41_9ACTN
MAVGDGSLRNQGPGEPGEVSARLVPLKPAVEGHRFLRRRRAPRGRAGQSAHLMGPGDQRLGQPWAVPEGVVPGEWA